MEAIEFVRGEEEAVYVHRFATQPNTDQASQNNLETYLAKHKAHHSI